MTANRKPGRGPVRLARALLGTSIFALSLSLAHPGSAEEITLGEASSLGAAAVVEQQPTQTRPHDFSLLGTQLKLRIIAQANPRSELSVISFPASAVVAQSRIEFPDVESLFNPNAPRPSNMMSRLVDVAIDAGSDFIEIDFANANSYRQFATAYQNTYVFTFDSDVPVEILQAQIDGATTLGLTPDRVAFANDELYVNVEGLRYDPSSFVRINLVTRAADPRRPRQQVALPVARPRSQSPAPDRDPARRPEDALGVLIPHMPVGGTGGLENLIRGGARDLIEGLFDQRRPAPNGRTSPQSERDPDPPLAPSPACMGSPEVVAECAEREVRGAAGDASAPVQP